MVTDPLVRFKHAFVTGATGIVGVPLCKQLSEQGVQVTAYSRAAGEFGLPPSVDHVTGDILDPSALKRAATGADIIFHVAAAVHGSASTYAEFEAMNVTGTANVVEVAKELGAKLVHVSTVNVEGFNRGVLADAYAATKAAAEGIVLAAVDDGSLDAVIVRPASVFGNVHGRAGMIVDRLLSGSLRVLPAPSRMISPVWVEDLARALIQSAYLGESGNIYTVAGPSTTTDEFVKSICAGAGVSSPVLSIPGWIIAVPLQLAWWVRRVTRVTPLVSVESVRNGSVHDGTKAARDLKFNYTSISEIFSNQ
jgi:nucleoside-diphosphate-sugar epimerase